MPATTAIANEGHVRVNCSTDAPPYVQGTTTGVTGVEDAP